MGNKSAACSCNIMLLPTHESCGPAPESALTWNNPASRLSNMLHCSAPDCRVHFLGHMPCHSVCQPGCTTIAFILVQAQLQASGCCFAAPARRRQSPGTALAGRRACRSSPCSPSAPGSPGGLPCPGRRPGASAQSPAGRLSAATLLRPGLLQSACITMGLVECMQCSVIRLPAVTLLRPGLLQSACSFDGIRHFCANPRISVSTATLLRLGLQCPHRCVEQSADQSA